MMNRNDTAARAANYNHRVDLDRMRPELDALVGQVVDATLSESLFQRALASGMNAVASMLRVVPSTEGRLLERGIGLIAKHSPDLVVLTDNLRLPVTRAAAELVEMNDAALVRSLSLDVDSGGRRSYTPDLLIVNRTTKVAHVVDVKRSLTFYDANRIADLKNRMLAAALVVPDLLYKEHRRLHVDEVRVVILNVDNQRTDIEGGIWPLAHLDHLVEIAGAGRIMAELRDLFRTRVEANWSAALNAHRASADDVCGASSAGSVTGRGGGADLPCGVMPVAQRVPISIGFARPPRRAGA